MVTEHIWVTLEGKGLSSMNGGAQFLRPTLQN